MPEFNCLSLLPTITAFIAFILSLLCLFAGTKTNFLTGTDILTVCLFQGIWVSANKFSYIHQSAMKLGSTTSTRSMSCHTAPATWEMMGQEKISRAVQTTTSFSRLIRRGYCSTNRGMIQTWRTWDGRLPSATISRRFPSRTRRWGCFMLLERALRGLRC